MLLIHLTLCHFTTMLSLSHITAITCGLTSWGEQTLDNCESCEYVHTKPSHSLPGQVVNSQTSFSQESLHWN